MFLNCGVREDSWEFLGLQGDAASQSWRKSVLNIHWKDWCWSWNSNTLATWCEELTHWKWPWCWERLKAGGEGDDRGWDGWMATPTQWTWVWVNSGSCWWTGRLGVLQSVGSQNWTEVHMFPCYFLNSSQPFLSPLCPQICSLCLRLHCCPANRLIRTILLFSIFHEVSIRIFCLFENRFVYYWVEMLFIYSIYIFLLSNQCFANIFSQP